MILYAESSAVLSWLLGEPEGSRVATELEAAEDIVTSDLTVLECERALVRGVAAGHLPEAVALDRRFVLNRALARWSFLRLDEPVLERARRTFPVEPIRSLDALHLASALVFRTEIPDLEVLSLDSRIVDNARAFGLPVRP